SELGLAFLRHRDLPESGEGLDFLVRLARPDDLPVPWYGLNHLDRDGLLLVVADPNLPLDLVEVRGDPLPVLLGALADHVEGIAHFDLDLLVFWCLAPPVLADELLAAGSVGLVAPPPPLGNRQAEPVLLAVLELEVDADLLVRHGDAVLRPVV